jgi:hypothetical protein
MQAAANGAAIHAALNHVRNLDVKINVLAERTSPAHFFVKCRGVSNVTLVMEGQPIRTRHTTCQIPNAHCATETLMGQHLLVVHCATRSTETEYVTFTWASPLGLQHRQLSLRFCPDREFGYLTIELLVDGAAQPELVRVENHFES